MRSCLPVILVGIILGGIELWAALFFVSQMEAGFCSGDAMHVALGMAVGVIATLALGTIFVYLVNEAMLNNRLGGGQVVVAAIGLTMLVMTGVTGYTLLSSREACPSLADMTESAASVCQGHGLPGASDWQAISMPGNNYTQNLMSLNDLSGSKDSDFESLFNLVVIGEDGQQIVWTNGARQRWQPSTLADLEFVVCVSSAEVASLPACQGNFISVQRSQEQVALRLVSARTGETLISGQMQAEAPECPGTSFSLARNLEGKVTYAQIERWVQDSLAQLPAIQANVLAQLTPVSTPQVNPIQWTAEPESTLQPVPTALPRGTSKCLARVRAGPGKDQAIIAGLVTGEEVEVIGANPEQTWLKVRTDQGVVGWVFAELLTIQAPLGELTTVN